MSTTAEKTPETTESDGRKRGWKKLVLLAVALLLVAGAAYWFVLRPSDPTAPPEPGEIVNLDATQINLADGHYLRLGLALQLTTTAKEANGSKALDAAIQLFSGKRLEQLEGGRRDVLKQRLATELEHLYEGDVMDVYFTEFVTQ